MPQRTVRLELARNACVEFVRGIAALRAYDYLIVVDCDEVNLRQPDRDAVARALGFLAQDEAHAGIFANNRGPYNDVWALRHSSLCPGDAWEEVMDYGLQNNVADEIAFRETFAKRMFVVDPARAPIEVDSSFNGLGIYKMPHALANRNPYLGARTRVMVREGKIGIVRLQTCEHVHFNLGIRNLGGRLFILPYLTNFESVAGKIPIPVSAWRALVF